MLPVDALEVVELDGVGWVSLPSLLRPFGKRVDNSDGLVDGWARVRFHRCTSRKGNGPMGRFEYGNTAAGVRLIHVEDAPLLIARLDGRGMDEETKAKHARYLRHVAQALAEHDDGGRHVG